MKDRPACLFYKSFTNQGVMKETSGYLAVDRNRSVL